MSLGLGPSPGRWTLTNMVRVEATSSTFVLPQDPGDNAALGRDRPCVGVLVLDQPTGYRFGQGGGVVSRIDFVREDRLGRWDEVDCDPRRGHVCPSY